MRVIVVDLGCKDFGFQDSISSLIDEYKPTLLIGFDPHPQLEHRSQYHGVPIELHQAAAWLFDGDVAFYENGTSSKTGEGAETVPCIDFSAWLAKRRRQVVVKMDVEGAEYDLLDRMIADGTDRKMRELVIEWHGDLDRAAEMTARLACPTRTWWM